MFFMNARQRPLSGQQVTETGAKGKKKHYRQQRQFELMFSSLKINWKKILSVKIVGTSLNRRLAAIFEFRWPAEFFERT